MFQKAVLYLAKVSMFAGRHFFFVQPMKISARVTIMTESEEEMPANNCPMLQVASESSDPEARSEGWITRNTTVLFIISFSYRI